LTFKESENRHQEGQILKQSNCTTIKKTNGFTEKSKFTLTARIFKWSELILVGILKCKFSKITGDSAE
jgi:hypothetical protein